MLAEIFSVSLAYFAVAFHNERRRLFACFTGLEVVCENILPHGGQMLVDQPRHQDRHSFQHFNNGEQLSRSSPNKRKVCRKNTNTVKRISGSSADRNTYVRFLKWYNRSGHQNYRNEAHENFATVAAYIDTAIHQDSNFRQCYGDNWARILCGNYDGCP